MELKIKKHIKSFVLRTGKLTSGQQKALDNHSSEYCISYSNSYLNFGDIFGNTNPIIIDIGFGMGHSFVKQVYESKEYNFVGVEVYPAGIGAAISGFVMNDSSNVKVIQHDAVEVLSNMVPENSIAKIQLLYPDPWHKKRHHKRRIVSASFLSFCHAALSQDGILQIVTDWEPYAEHIKAVISSSPYFNLVEEGVIDFSSSPDIYNTSFAKKAVAKGHVINNILAKKINS
jgi:tRNA (guanine-N7-)-methyltransferase